MSRGTPGGPKQGEGRLAVNAIAGVARCSVAHQSDAPGDPQQPDFAVVMLPMTESPRRDGMIEMHRAPVQRWGKRALMKHPNFCVRRWGLWGAAAPSEDRALDCIVNLDLFYPQQNKMQF